MIKAATRPNLRYPLQLLLYKELRNIESILINRLLKFDDALLFTLLMFLGEFLSGLIIYLYQIKILKKNKDPGKYMILKFVKSKNVKKIDGILKIFFIIFCCALFDYVQFILSIYTPQFINVSPSINSRIAGFLTIFDALFYYFVLRLSILKHQLFCLIIMGACLLILIIFEFIFQEINIFLTYGQFFSIFILSFIGQFLNALIDSNEKYLFEYDNENPFYVLMFEGVFGFAFSLFHCIFKNPFDTLKDYKNNKEHSNSDFGLLIFCLIIYTILSGLRNSYRVITTKVYSPMTTTFIDYILNPIYISVDFALGKDFMKKGKRNYAHFFINLIIILIISFLGLVYNEFLILYFCNLDEDTYKQVSRRGSRETEFIISLDVISVDDSEL